MSGRLTRRVAREGRSPEAVADWRSLAIIEQYEPVSIGGLARAYGCSQPAATKIVNRLELRDSVIREISDADARVTRVSLTEAGRERLADVRDEAHSALEPLTSTWTEEDRAAVRRTVELMGQLIDEAARNER